ncbi:hypothetical protein KRR26_29605 [Corallococcus sp. M34]|uniref:hypothetical protein n=1 Tax=Citreicoccus inhibens TaxID=2849499 RepID=UPI0018F52778|nr:hypothetical protein [Citreicoccus inhibens]MBU8899775.1 hypothetical protein [Citreicoccus inhibens]
MSNQDGVLVPLRVRVRRFQFIVGLGFLSLVLGSILSVALTLRLSTRVLDLPFEPLRIAMAVALENLWVLGVLPALAYGAARAFDLRPWNTAVGSGLSGALFVVALDLVRDGTGSLWEGGLPTVLRWAAFGVGVFLTAQAVKAGRAAAATVASQAATKAEARKSEYDEFLQAAAQGGARLEQREGALAAGVATPPAATVDVASAPVTSLPLSAASEPVPVAPPEQAPSEGQAPGAVTSLTPAGTPEAVEPQAPKSPAA